jgi:UvrB/uvrC motif
MDMKVDLRDVLKNWPYDPENDVRRVAVGGREVLQVRLPLGIEQYELEERPDGERPYGKESVLDHHLERLAEAERAGKESEFVLNSDDCSELFSEGTLYYYRYLHLFQIKDWPGTVRDTARNLRLFDLVHRYAEDEEDQFYLEQWRPYLVRMNAAAAAMIQLEQDLFEPALQTVHSAIASIEALEELDDETFQFERERSLAALKDMASQIEESKPVSELEHLERELRQAIETQHFERAADLRDRIRALRATNKG